MHAPSTVDNQLLPVIGTVRVVSTVDDDLALTKRKDRCTDFPAESAQKKLRFHFLDHVRLACHFLA